MAIFLQLRIYAGKDITGIIQDSGNTHLVGFSLPSSSVSAYHTTAKSDFWLYVAYVLSTFVLYASCITTILFVVSKSEQRGIKSFTKRNLEVLKATIIVIGSFVLVEIVAELVIHGNCLDSECEASLLCQSLVSLYLQPLLYIVVLV